MNENILAKLQNKDTDIESLVRKALKDTELLSELLDGLKSKEETFRYNCVKVLTLISQEHGEVLYPKWDYFTELLSSTNTYRKISAVVIIANLANYDTDSRFEKILDKYYQILNDRSMIAAIYAASNSGKIVRAKPELEPRITSELLNIDATDHRDDRKDLIKSGIIEALDQYFEASDEKQKIIEFVENQLNSSSPKTRKAASEFLKKWT